MFVMSHLRALCTCRLELSQYNSRMAARSRRTSRVVIYSCRSLFCFWYAHVVVAFERAWEAGGMRMKKNETYGWRAGSQCRRTTEADKLDGIATSTSTPMQQRVLHATALSLLQHLRPHTMSTRPVKTASRQRAASEARCSTRHFLTSASRIYQPLATVLPRINAQSWRSHEQRRQASLLVMFMLKAA